MQNTVTLSTKYCSSLFDLYICHSIGHVVVVPKTFWLRKHTLIIIRALIRIFMWLFKLHQPFLGVFQWHQLIFRALFWAFLICLMLTLARIWWCCQCSVLPFYELILHFSLWSFWCSTAPYRFLSRKYTRRHLNLSFKKMMPEWSKWCIS